MPTRGICTYNISSYDYKSADVVTQQHPHAWFACARMQTMLCHNCCHLIMRENLKACRDENLRKKVSIERDVCTMAGQHTPDTNGMLTFYGTLTV